jgi:uncharacterized protein (DUF58 family)
LLGAVELAGLAAGAVVAVGLAVARVRGQAVTYEVVRSLEPGRVEVGGPAQARLRFTNTAGRPARHLTVAVDGFDGGRGAARCLVPPLAPGEVAEATYDLPTVHRSVVTVGPLLLSVTDPLGLAEVTTVAAGDDRLVVHPRIEALLPGPGATAHEARLGAQHASRVPVGLDFFTLREYEVGDDLRRVHWRSTARVGDLMLRQDELPWEQVATLLVDTRASAHTPESFERAMEVAASVAAAAVRDGRRLRFVTTGGFELEAITARWTVLLDHLAAATPEDHDRFPWAVDSLRRRPAGPLVAVIGSARPVELAALAGLQLRSGVVMVADCSPGGQAAPPRAVVVRVPPGAALAPAWNQAILSCRRAEAAPR